ncbi:MAG: c-type cytochrome domain-containing protein [Verrucomicrobiota bacterium]
MTPILSTALAFPLKRSRFLAPITTCLLVLSGIHSTQAAPPNWDDHIRPILKNRCFKCHGEEDQKGDLNLQTLAAALKGGTSGEVLKKNRPNSSILLQSILHEEGVEKMPPKSSKLPDEEIELIRQWILAGLPEKSGSPSSAPATFAFKPSNPGTKPANPAMPANLPALPSAGKRANPVTALASSPWAPLIATGGHGQIAFFNAETKTNLGAIPFPEGIPQVLRFSRDGSTLLVAGGKPVQSGKVVLFDVATGKRLAAFGDETDTVLAADFSPDGKLVAIGGPNKLVKVFHTADGSLAYKITKHMDWVTALEFSPDGSRLASGDRAAGIYVWEAATGGIAMTLAEHKEAISSLTWRPDGNIIASASEDGSVILWNMKDGFPSATLTGIHTPKPQGKRYGKVPGGVLSLVWTPEGHMLSVGRDNAVREWDSNGGKLSAVEGLPTLPSRVTGTFDGKLAVIGDAEGRLLWWPKGAKEATLTP